jgi:glucose uptake protein GlcU
MADHTPGARTINMTVAAVFGAIYTLVGLAGFFVSDTFAEQDDNTLLGFEVNHLHNIVHLLIGVALLAASRRHAAARSANLTIGAVYLVLGVLGPFIQDTAADVIALNGADHVLHVLSGLVLLAVALLADRDARSRTGV